MPIARTCLLLGHDRLEHGHRIALVLARYLYHHPPNRRVAAERGHVVVSDRRAHFVAARQPAARTRERHRREQRDVAFADDSVVDQEPADPREALRLRVLVPELVGSRCDHIVGSDEVALLAVEVVHVAQAAVAEVERETAQP